ncbi:hypothetical protein FOXG_13392 [Fusarium oxysporum f. sp. lycopersici 4287]|uniref:Heterokaryon incompatibility domain-containing protein n=1 Tax=Fusarium oxysporum f. sp. lycopersici (strain 4287 / CBS 123668 / FGSC 9935 / NRRL 34936) TaxID=426428 RepID=A0A0J9VVD4_FUSO4|nr:hypothetical protein FOXG_13392 [Fusarium oxysporum f. sp. lycopersici 4287]KNB14575.1 hypothetical protein FOXG_13392 [Fusarium oxysporum f. sp. lycopersici 4287]
MSDALRSNILPIMDKFFSTAETTVLYFDDVGPNVVNELCKDKQTPERLSSVISVCNSKCFERVWTAMEFIRSERVRMMISNYTYFPDLDDPAFLGQVFKAWKDEVRQHEKVHDLERKVQMGKNEVPRSLSTLKSAKLLKRMNFAMATALRCKRGCKNRMNFLHALRGIEVHPPTLGKYTTFNDSEQRITLRIEDIGTVSIVGRPEQGSMMQAFSSAAKLALEIDGPDVRDFIATLGRTHPGNALTTMEILEEKNEVNNVQRVLNKLFNCSEIPSWPTDGKDNIKWLRDVLSFSKLRPGDDQTVLGDNAARFGTIHCRPYHYTVGITCTGCDRMFAHEIESFVLQTELRNARAYRIPGLKYLCSEKDSLAILVYEDKVVGRMIWATPACACGRTEVVTLRIPELFMPRIFDQLDI